MTNEWTLEQIINFTKAGHQSVSARIVKCVIDHYTKDLCEFAEWHRKYPEHYNSKMYYKEGRLKTTPKLQIDWEIETGRREKS